MKNIWPVSTWEKDLLLRVNNVHDIDVKDEELRECKEKQICIRRKNMAKDVSAAGSKNLYEILKLNMKEVRGKPTEEQNEIIKRAYHSQLRRWHPDRNPEHGDSAICQEIIYAYKILKNPESRAAYNNVADFDKGWFSRARYKAIFKPECYSDEQRKQYRNRMGLLLLSGFLIAGGVAITFFTAGMAAPVALGMTAASGAIMGGGISSALQTINRDAIEKGCSFGRYFKSLCIGALGGAAMGAGVAGIAMFLGGAAKLALKGAEVSLERKITARIATRAFRGFITSLTNSIHAALTDDSQKTGRKKILNFLKNVLLNAWLGGIAGLPGGFAENMIENVSFVEEDLEMLQEYSSDTRDVVEETTTVALNTFADIIEERLDENVENKPIVDHLEDGAKGAAIAVTKYVAKALSKATDGNNEQTDKEIKNDTRTTSEENDGAGASLPSLPSYKSPKAETNDNDDLTKRPLPSSRLSRCSNNNDVTECKEHRLKYISEGLWLSKMVVEYKKNGKTEKYERDGSNSSILIPNTATDIKVKFLVLRFLGVWCDVKKYDRFKKRWIKPNQPHTFEYNTPVSRTYTLSGNLYYEAVTKIVNEDYEDVNEI